jgi:hypothetical protein
MEGVRMRLGMRKEDPESLEPLECRLYSAQHQILGRMILPKIGDINQGNFDEIDNYPPFVDLLRF